MFIAISCTKPDLNEINNDKQDQSLLIKTKVLGEGLDSYFINEEDIDNYISFKKLEKSPVFENNDIEEIIPIKWNDATCLYVLDFEKGYEILSADKRSPIPLVYDREGNFEFPSDESPLGFHINSLTEDVWFSLYNNDVLDEPDYETRSNMESSMLFWALVNSDLNAFQNQGVQTKAGNDTIILNPDEGHWELVNVSYYDSVYDTVGHFVPTWWTQDAPFNNYCPKDSLTSLTRCPAGGVAVAAAQVLNYLHYKLGVPDRSPSYGSCTGYVYNNTVNQYFGSFSAATWAGMQPSSDPSGYAAMLIGDVGKKIHMNYGTKRSTANTLDLRDSVFHPYGIQCANHNNYSGSFLKANLENRFPVICTGQRQETDPQGT